MHKILALFIVPTAVVVAVSAEAQSHEQRAVVDGVLKEVIEEQRLIHTCGATFDPRGVTLMDNFWQDMFAETIEWLELNELSSPTISEFAELGTAASLRMSDETPFGEVISLCQANPEWSQKMGRMEVIRVPAAIITALAENQ